MNEDAYSRRQRARDAEYSKDYDAWVKSEPDANREKLKALGLDKPLIPGSVGGYQELDFAESPLASEEPDIAAQVDELLSSAEQPTDTVATPTLPYANAEQIWEIMRCLIGELLARKNAKLAIECLAVVSGVSFLGGTMAGIAHRFGMSRAAVSKRCVEFANKLRMPPSRSMRSLTARKSYARARKRRVNSYE